MTTAHVAAAPRRLLAPETGQAGFADALRSEFTKIRSTRSTYWTLLALVVVTIGFGALACAGAASHGADGPGFDATRQSLAGLYLGQLVIAVLGALTITSEYSTGMIRTSLAVQPRRGTVFAAKAVVFAAVSLVTGLVASFASFFVGQAILSGDHNGVSVTLGDPNVLRAVVGGALFLTACGMLAYGLGAILRHTAGAITAAIGLLFVLTVLVNFLPMSWQNHVDKWVPAMAGAEIWTTKASPPPPQLFSPWAGFAVLAAYAAVAIVAGLVLFRTRDA